MNSRSLARRGVRNVSRKPYCARTIATDPSNLAQAQASSTSTSNLTQPQQSNALRDAILTAIAGLFFVGVSGVAYHSFYKWNQLRKIDVAFRAGYDPVLELDAAAKSPRHFDATTLDDEDESTAHLRRREQDLIDRIVDGKEAGHYYLLQGPKGAGKGTMIVDAMRKNLADGVASFEAHEDTEVFRLRLGKCLNFEFYEDSASILFQRRDPREAGALLDIERALNKLEKVAIAYAKRRNRPLVLVINNCHLIHQDEEGFALLHALQQRAESWAQAKVLTTVFVSDDYWIFNKLRKNGSRMSMIQVDDLTERETIAALRAGRPECTTSVGKAIFSLMGGRLALISKVLRGKTDFIERAHEVIEQEKNWLLSRRTLIPDHDDDVMDQQKEASCAWLLFQALVQRDDELRASGIPADKTDPFLNLADAHVVMTRIDFIDGLDHENISLLQSLLISSRAEIKHAQHRVRADSRMLLNAMREVVEAAGFQASLDQTRTRIDAIESLHRTRELIVKPDNPGTFRMSLERAA